MRLITIHDVARTWRHRFRPKPGRLRRPPELAPQIRPQEVCLRAPAPKRPNLGSIRSPGSTFDTPVRETYASGTDGSTA